MKIGLTDKQIGVLMEKSKKTEFTEQEGAPSAGTSTSSGGQGYPSVGKWESGITRGPANQVGVTKWADVVGGSLKRGKANPLK